MRPSSNSRRSSPSKDLLRKKRKKRKKSFILPYLTRRSGHATCVGAQASGRVTARSSAVAATRRPIPHSSRNGSNRQPTQRRTDERRRRTRPPLLLGLPSAPHRPG